MTGVDQPLGRVTVAHYEDGYVSVRNDPKVADEAHLRKAAETFQRLATPALQRTGPWWYFLPIIVAGIAMIVQNSIALAFSLAGIVAETIMNTS